MGLVRSDESTTAEISVLVFSLVKHLLVTTEKKELQLGVNLEAIQQCVGKYMYCSWYNVKC